MKFAGCFIKFGKLEHLQALRDRGLLYCNAISFFTAIEDNGLRGDAMETVTQLNHVQNGSMWIRPVHAPTEPWKRFDYVQGHFRECNNDMPGNLFCLYALNVLSKPLGTIYTIDRRNKEFGDHMLLITEPHAFLERLEKAIKSLNFDFSYDMVEYTDLSRHRGKKSLFQKDMAYNFQQEFRLVIYNNESKPLILEIGSLQDISFILNSSLVDIFELSASIREGDMVELHCNLQLPV